MSAMDFYTPAQPEDTTHIFNFDGQDVRTFRDENGAAWFVLADVCSVLGIGNASDTKKRLNQADLNSIEVRNVRGERRPTTVVNESGLYDVALDSRKPQAKAFRRWITTEVVPALRATGQYTMPGHPAAQPAPAVDPAVLAQAISTAVSQADVSSAYVWSAQNSGVTCHFTGASKVVDRPGRAVERAVKSAENTGVTCRFMESHKTPVNGGPARVDYHLDRMAAYPVAMNGDPRKPEVAAAGPPGRLPPWPPPGLQGGSHRVPAGPPPPPPHGLQDGPHRPPPGRLVTYPSTPGRHPHLFGSTLPVPAGVARTSTRAAPHYPLPIFRLVMELINR